MSQNTRVRAWDDFWNCTGTIIDLDSNSKNQKELQEIIGDLVKMPLPIYAIDRLTSLVHAVYDVAQERQGDYAGTITVKDGKALSLSNTIQDGIHQVRTVPKDLKLIPMDASLIN